MKKLRPTSPGAEGGVARIRSTLLSWMLSLLRALKISSVSGGKGRRWGPGWRRGPGLQLKGRLPRRVRPGQQANALGYGERSNCPEMLASGPRCFPKHLQAVPPPLHFVAAHPWSCSSSFSASYGACFRSGCLWCRRISLPRISSSPGCLDISKSRPGTNDSLMVLETQMALGKGILPVQKGTQWGSIFTVGFILRILMSDGSALG